MRIEADNLELAYKNAVSEFKCSITELEIQLIQSPNKGFLGFFRKKAIIEVDKINKSQNPSKNSKSEKIPLNDEILKEIQASLEDLFSSACFKMKKITVKRLSKDLLYIHFDSEDNEALIGKDGGGYRSLSFMIYGWLNLKYALNVKFNIGDYANCQEKNIQEYLEVLSKKIEKEAKVTSKILDNQSSKILLSALRQRFPNKFVGIKLCNEGKYILIKDFKEKQ